MVSGLEFIRVPESGSVEIRFTARANKSYTVEYRDSLTTGSWQRLEDVATDPLEHPGFTITDTPPLEAKLRFIDLSRRKSFERFPFFIETAVLHRSAVQLLRHRLLKSSFHHEPFRSRLIL